MTLTAPVYPNDALVDRLPAVASPALLGLGTLLAVAGTLTALGTATNQPSLSLPASLGHGLTAAVLAVCGSYALAARRVHRRLRSADAEPADPEKLRNAAERRGRLLFALAWSVLLLGLLACLHRLPPRTEEVSFSEVFLPLEVATVESLIAALVVLFLSQQWNELLDAWMHAPSVIKEKPAENGQPKPPPAIIAVTRAINIGPFGEEEIEEKPETPVNEAKVKEPIPVPETPIEQVGPPREKYRW